MRDFFKNMFSEGSAASCMRFCTTIVVITIMANYTILNMAMVFKPDFIVNMSTQDIVALLGVLGIKLGQKVREKKNEI